VRAERISDMTHGLIFVNQAQGKGELLGLKLEFRLAACASPLCAGAFFS